MPLLHRDAGVPQGTSGVVDGVAELAEVILDIAQRRRSSLGAVVLTHSRSLSTAVCSGVGEISCVTEAGSDGGKSDPGVGDVGGVEAAEGGERASPGGRLVAVVVVVVG